jgi:hypothetical protein
MTVKPTAIIIIINPSACSVARLDVATYASTNADLSAGVYTRIDRMHERYIR